jgi:hypothetical protein
MCFAETPIRAVAFVVSCSGLRVDGRMLGLEGRSSSGSGVLMGSCSKLLRMSKFEFLEIGVKTWDLLNLVQLAHGF